MSNDPDSPLLDDAAIRAEIGRAVQELKQMTAVIDVMAQFETSEWELDQSEGVICFHRSDNVSVCAPAQIVGTFNCDDSTWLWGWDHPSVDASMARVAKIVKEYGQRHDVPALAMRKLVCQESDCWEFTALACMLGKEQGAYRGVAGSTYVFMTLGQLRFKSNW